MQGSYSLLQFYFPTGEIFLYSNQIQTVHRAVSVHVRGLLIDFHFPAREMLLQPDQIQAVHRAVLVHIS